MRLAIIADIHGNLVAFEAALEHIRRQGVDQIVIAGDVVTGSPDSAACWQLARSLGCPIVRGNHERYVADFDTPRAAAIWSRPQFAPLQWTVAQLSAVERTELDALPPFVRLPELLVVHGSMRSDIDMLPAALPEEQLPRLFPATSERVIARAHDHIAGTYLWGEQRVITVGSVGLPLNGLPTVQYLLLDRAGDGWRTAHQSVPYDLDAALERFVTSGYLKATGVMGRLFRRELATATFQVVPFLRFLERHAEQTEADLERAMERYLAL
jgi:predicted phosphodiesterase